MSSPQPQPGSWPQPQPGSWPQPQPGPWQQPGSWPHPDHGPAGHLPAGHLPAGRPTPAEMRQVEQQWVADPVAYQDAPSGLPIGGMVPEAPVNPYHLFPPEPAPLHHTPQSVTFAMPEPPPAGPIRRPSGALMLAAGVAATAGSAMVWMTVGLPGAVRPFFAGPPAPVAGTGTSFSGLQTDAGRFTAALGLLLVILGWTVLTGQGRRHRVAAFAGLTALALLGVGAWQIRAVQASRAEVRAALADSPYRAMADAMQVTVGPGLWILTAGAAVALLAAVVNLRRPRPAG